MGGNLSFDKETKDEDITVVLQVRQSVLTALTSIHFVGYMYLIAQTLVIGYCVVNPNGGTAVPHAIWLLAPAWLLFSALLMTRLEVTLKMRVIRRGIIYLYIVCAICIITNAIGLGLFAWELSEGVSDFAVTSYGFLVATVVVTAIFVVLELLLIWALSLYWRDLRKALHFGWVPKFHENSPLLLSETDNKQLTQPSLAVGDAEKIRKNLQYYQTFIATMTGVHLIISMYLIVQTLVVGYCVVDPNGQTAVPHTVWLLAPLWIEFAVLLTTRFEVGLEMLWIARGKMYVLVVCGVAALLNIVALILFIIELAVGVSVFATTSHGFLIVTIVMTCIYIALEATVFALIWVFMKKLRSAIDQGWTPVYEKEKTTVTVIKKNDEVTPLLPKKETNARIVGRRLFK